MSLIIEALGNNKDIVSNEIKDLKENNSRNTEDISRIISDNEKIVAENLRVTS